MKTRSAKGRSSDKVIDERVAELTAILSNRPTVYCKLSCEAV